uniref:Serine/threonine-protein kinase 17B n=1 Tax=Equus asinus TaxID=9793 RepID=A0A8C4MTL5_EQUAS
MSRRRFDCRSISGLLTTMPQTPMKMENFNNFYTLTSKELGRGKFAVVRQCISKSTGQEYAAKFLKKRRRGQDCRAEILHEIAVLELAKSCPHVINLHEVYENASEIILILEYAAGGEIFNLCLPEVAEMVSENDIIRLIKQILEGVYYLHQNNIVHLDLKPQNILLSSIYPLGDIKIVDFGMSRKIGNACELREIMGTPEYLAPEILNYDPITTATDMWNIGIIAYMLLTHTSPFVGEDNQETYLNISQVNVDYSEETFSSVSQLATDFVQSLLVKNPEGPRRSPASLTRGCSSGTLETCFTLKKLLVPLRVRITCCGPLKTGPPSPPVMEPVVTERTKRTSRRIAAWCPKGFALMTRCPLPMNLSQICSVSTGLFDSLGLHLEFEIHSHVRWWFAASHMACLYCKCTFA